jgi:hypothetical protein
MHALAHQLERRVVSVNPFYIVSCVIIDKESSPAIIRAYFLCSVIHSKDKDFRHIRREHKRHMYTYFISY